MRSLLQLIIGAVLVGLGLGAVLGYYQAQPWTVVHPLSLEDKSDDAEPIDTDVRPEAEVPEQLYNFGNMEQGTTLSHAFKVRNVGKRPLMLAVASTTCKCTVGDLQDNQLAPGAETDVLLEWTAKTAVGPFRHGATLSTNDPKNLSITLTVEGDVVESTSVIPGELLFGEVSAGEEATAELFILSRFQEEVEVTDYLIGDPDLADQIKLEFVPVAPEEFPVPDAVGAVKVKATLQADRTIGRFMGWIGIETNLEKAARLSIFTAGNTVGDISIFGRGWLPEKGLLRMGSVSSSKGKQARLIVSTRGEHAQATEIEVIKTIPHQLKATLGQREEIGDELVHVPLILEIPPGTPPMVRLGEPASSDALVVLRTTHPKAKEVQLRVHFTVEP